MDTITDFQNTTTFLPSDLKEVGEKTIRSFAKPWYPYIITLDTIAIIFAALLNILPIVAYFKFDSLKTPTTLLICNQSIADILGAIQSFFYLIFNLTEWGFNFASSKKFVCLFMITGILLSYLMSLVNLLLLSVERFIAIMLPYKYFKWVTDSAIKKVLISVWTSLTILTSLPLFGLNTWDRRKKCRGLSVLNDIYMTYMVLLNILVTLIFTALANFIIACTAIKKSRVIPANIKDAPTDTDNNTTLNDKKDLKITKMLPMVVGVSYFSMAPYMVLTAMLLYPSGSWIRTGPPENILIAHEIYKGVVIWGSAAHPVIYALRNSKYRTAFRKLLGLKVTHDID